MDSELMTRQLGGDYRVKSAELKPLFEKALGILKTFGSFEIKHIEREKNKDADRLANKAINLASLF
jgi:ribonuclease HI